MSTTMDERAPGSRVMMGGVTADSTVESSASAVSWAAIFAGAFVAASASVILVALGSGLGFAAISPWSDSGASLTTFAISTGIWLVVVQWVASGLGGYVTGRLRTKWVGTHTHEVFFRDTAHGLVTWALATVIVAAGAALAGSAGARAVAASARDVVQAGATGQNAVSEGAVSGYEVDRLFRAERAGAPAADLRAEATRILVKGVASGDIPAADRTYLVQLVVARSGISESEAEARVNDVMTRVQAAGLKVRQAADAARKAAAAASICTALALLIGAFIASVSAALGGMQRDEAH